MGILKDRIKRTGRAIAWSKQPNRTVILPKENPCRKCGWCIERGNHNVALLLDICYNPERIKNTGRDWTVTNSKGEHCMYFDKDKQLRFGVDI